MQRQGNNAIQIERKNRTIRVKSKVVPNKHVSSLKEISIKKNYGLKRVSDSYNYKNIYDDGLNSH